MCFSHQASTAATYSAPHDVYQQQQLQQRQVGSIGQTGDAVSVDVSRRPIDLAARIPILPWSAEAGPQRPHQHQQPQNQQQEEEA